MRGGKEEKERKERRRGYGGRGDLKKINVKNWENVSKLNC